jgi:peptidoglycan-associated lipoprotein
MKRNLIIATMVVFAVSSIFLVCSCAKKQVVAEEEEITAPPVGPEVVIVEEEELPAVEVAKEVEEEVVETYDIGLPEEMEVEAVEEGLAAKFEGKSVYFDFDKSFIKPEYRPVLEEKAGLLKDNPNIHIRIEGNCDERGTNEYNIALGERRANSAKSFLVSLGISPDRVETISYGEERPLFLSHDEDSWSKNRRDDFLIIGE